MRKFRGWMALLIVALLLAAGSLAQAEAAIRLRYTSATLAVGQSATMRYQVRPADARVSWSSADESIATVNGAGRITAHKAGSTVITASCSGAKASCKLTVKPPRITAVRLSAKSKTVSLSQGSVQLKATVKPAAADASTLKWVSSKPSVATVSQQGLVTLKSTGTARIAAQSPAGRRAVCTIKVVGESSLMTRRALVIGEGRANSTYHLAELPMTPGEVRKIGAMFTTRGVKTTMLVNTTYNKVTTALHSAFSGADENDVSFVYIACHGGAQGASYYLYLSGNARMSAKTLRSLLDSVPGKIVLMLDCCESGAVINKDARATSFLEAFAPGAVGKYGEFVDDKYKVLCACASTQSGWGVISRDARGNINEENTYNFFAKAVQEGASGSADADANGQLTLNELYLYAKARVAALYTQWSSRISLDANGTQTVTAYPANSSFVLF